MSFGWLKPLNTLTCENLVTPVNNTNCKKASALDIRMICPLHGPMLRGKDIAIMVDKYCAWSTYTPESNGVLIAYASMYGHTASAADRLAGRLSEQGIADVRVDLTRGFIGV